MLNCSFTKKIPSYQCIGDSLRTINSNFSALDAGICDLPQIDSHGSVSTRPGVDRFGNNTIDLQIQSEPVFVNEFNHTSSAVSLSSMYFSDGTTANAYVFPYDGSQLNQKPFGTFEVNSNDIGSPQLTLYWMSSSQNSLATVFASNSSISIGQKGPMWFNDTVDCFYKDNNILYVGGQFTKVGNSSIRKFAAINLDLGPNSSTLGTTGSAVQSPLDAGGDLGSTGTVNFITKTTISGNELIIVGGSFNSTTKGRGLVIYNKTLGISYPFYFNGELRDFILNDLELYVCGEFDFCNYGSSAATFSSGGRIYSKSLAKISLPLLFTSPNACIDEDFASFVEADFKNSTSLYALHLKGTTLYAGGDFRIVNGTVTEHRNLIAIQTNGQKVDSWKCIVDGPVYTITADPLLGYMYVGGDFSTVTTQADLYNPLVPLPETTKAHNACCFSLPVSGSPVFTDWKPKFNGPVHKMVVNQLNDIGGHIYCTGQFTEVNYSAVGHICAIIKKSAVFDNTGILASSWPMNLQTGSSPNTNALFKDTNSLFVGGNFTSVNGQVRYHFARVAGINESPLITTPKNVSWDIGGQIVSKNQSFVFDFNNLLMKRSIVEVGPFGSINKTTFEPLTEGFKGAQKNQLCRFYIKRPGNIGNFQQYYANDDSYKEKVFLLGWSINFNK